MCKIGGKNSVNKEESCASSIIHLTHYFRVTKEVKNKIATLHLDKIAKSMIKSYMSSYGGAF
jgi:hypothetical protein